MLTNDDLIGNTVIFNDLVVRDTELDFCPGMKAVIRGIFETIDDISTVVLDFSDFLEHNRRLMRPIYYDRNGLATLTWEQSLFWPKNLKHVECYIDHRNLYDPDHLIFSIEPIGFGFDVALQKMKSGQMVWSKCSILDTCMKYIGYGIKDDVDSLPEIFHVQIHSDDLILFQKVNLSNRRILSNHWHVVELPPEIQEKVWAKS